MIITCPSCNSRFVVKAEVIGEKGRTVKCAKCANKWFQEPDNEALNTAKETSSEPSGTEPLKEGSNVPAEAGAKTPVYLKLSMAASILFLFITISVVSANSILPSMSFYYNIFGIYDTTDIALYDIKAEQVESGKYNDLLVSGKIVNESDKEKYLPDLRIEIYDEKNGKIKTVTLDSEGAAMQPGEKINFENRIPRIPNDSSVVIFDIGNKLDLASR